MPAEGRNIADGNPGVLPRIVLLRSTVCTALLGILVIVLLFTTARLIMFFSFTEFSLLSGRMKEVGRMFGHGIRYDIRTATIAFAPFTLIGLLLISWPKGSRSYIQKLRYILTGLFLVGLTAAICNYFYYATYGSYFDVFIFGLFEEDTRAVLSSLWNDYPIIRFVAVLALSGYAVYRAVDAVSKRFFTRKWQQRPLWLETALLLIFLICYGYGVHGSIGRYPLERRDAQVSSLKVLNMLTPNAIMALDWAISDHKKERKYPPADDVEGQKLFSAFYRQQVPLKDVSLNQFADITPRNDFLEKHPPHVVLAVMESLSTHLLLLDAPPATDMLGAWRPYWKRDFVFTRFLSEGNGTMESLARLLVASPVSNISQTRAQRTPFSGNLIKPYKLRGYRTLFVTSGNGSWRNLSGFLKQLGFDDVVEQSDLIRKYPEAVLGTWGTFDEFSFRYVEERLKEADSRNEKLFVMMLSITNHPPYTVPATFQSPPHAIDDSIRQRLSALSYSPDAIIATFQYANDAIGRFIQRVEGSPFGRRTLIAVTGDHNIRGVAYPDPAEIVAGSAVPFYLRVPPEYRNAAGVTYDPLRIGSHKDIMPTLYALSLSGTPYYRRGVNLLAKNVSSPWYFAYNELLGLTEKGAYRLTAPQMFYPWQDSKSLLVSQERQPDGVQNLELEHINTYKSIMSWQLNRQVNRQP